MSTTEQDPTLARPIERQEPARKAWWLATRRRRPEWQALSATGTAWFGGRPRAHFGAASPGDVVALYVSKPDHAVVAIALVSRRAGTGTAEASEAGGIELQLAFDLPNPLPWREIVSEPDLAAAQPVRQRSSGTLFRLSAEEYAALRSMIEARNPELASSFAALDARAEPPSQAEAPPESTARAVREQPATYAARPPAPALPEVRTLSDLQSLTSLPLDRLDECRELLEDTGQIVISGPPGTGKTWLARGLATLLAGDPSRVEVVQFHPSTTYEDFIEGLKPRVDAQGNVTYAVTPGLFVRFCERARLDPDRHHVLVIDEINRASLARVFGELLYALEYRGPAGAVQLSLSGSMEEGGRPFWVPENLLVIGTMNSADRSLAVVDYALRRRFRFVELEPNLPALDRWLEEQGTSPAIRQPVLRLLMRLNDRLSELLDPDHRIGQSYFMLDPMSSAALDRLWRTAIKPLIAEYFVTAGGELDEFRSMFAEAAADMEATQ